MRDIHPASNPQPDTTALRDLDPAQWTSRDREGQVRGNTARAGHALAAVLAHHQARSTGATPSEAIATAVTHYVCVTGHQEDHVTTVTDLAADAQHVSDALRINLHAPPGDTEIDQAVHHFHTDLAATWQDPAMPWSALAERAWQHYQAEVTDARA